MLVYTEIMRWAKQIPEEEGDSLGCRLQTAPKCTLRRPGYKAQALRLSRGVSCTDPCHLDPIASKTQAMVVRIPGLSPFVVLGLTHVFKTLSFTDLFTHLFIISTHGPPSLVQA